MYNVHSRTFHANFIGFVLTLAYSRISALPFCLRYLFNANSFFASSSFVSFNRKMGLSIKGINLLFLNKSKYGIFPRLIKTQHQLTMSDQNACKFLTEMSNCLKIFHEYMAIFVNIWSKYNFVLPMSDKNRKLSISCDNVKLSANVRSKYNIVDSRRRCHVCLALGEAVCRAAENKHKCWFFSTADALV